MTQQQITVIGGYPITRMPSTAEVREIFAPGSDGEVRLHLLEGLDFKDGEWIRFVPGWYVEVFRDGEWRREAGPFMDTLAGCPQEAWDAALKLSE